MKFGVKTALAAISIIVYVFCIILSISLSEGVAGSMVTMILIGGIFVFLNLTGAALIFGRGGFMLAGWNTMTAEERSRFDEKKVLRSAGILIIVFSAGIMFSLLCFTERLPLLGWILMALSFITMFAGVVHLGKSGKLYSV